jgi:hypothetical protein
VLACLVFMSASSRVTLVPNHHPQIYATDPPVWPDIDFVSFKSNRARQRKGKSIRFTGIFRVNNFGLNDITYCGVSRKGGQGGRERCDR